MTLGPVRVMGVGVVVIKYVEDLEVRRKVLFCIIRGLMFLPLLKDYYIAKFYVYVY